MDYMEDIDFETILEADRTARVASAEVILEMTKQAVRTG